MRSSSKVTANKPTPSLDKHGYKNLHTHTDVQILHFTYWMQRLSPTAVDLSENLHAASGFLKKTVNTQSDE